MLPIVARLLTRTGRGTKQMRDQPAGATAAATDGDIACDACAGLFEASAFMLQPRNPERLQHGSSFYLLISSTLSVDSNPTPSPTTTPAPSPSLSPPAD